MEATMPRNTGGRPTQAILGEALDELHERRGRLLPFVEELKQVEKAIATLERAAGTLRKIRGDHPSPTWWYEVVADVTLEAIGREPS